MLLNLSQPLTLIFITTTLLTGFMLTRAAVHKIWIVVFALVWLSIQAVISLQGIYHLSPNVTPPKIILFGILPMIVIILLLLFTKAGKRYIDTFSVKRLTYLHLARIPVEISLYYLFVAKSIPEIMTFKGQNFDIVAGITAPFVAYYADKLGKRTVLVWNFVCLALLLNIVITAFFSAPSPLQQLAFDQPNIAILYFPFSWLPTFIVPIVLFAHLVSIRQLLKR